MSARVLGVIALCLTVPLMLGCLGLSLGLGPLQLGIGAVEPPKPAPEPSPVVKKDTTVVDEGGGALRQEGQVGVPPRSSTAVYYLRPFGQTPHLELSEPGEEGVNFLISEQEPDHFKVANTSLLFSRTFAWRARGAKPVVPQADGGLPQQPVPVR